MKKLLLLASVILFFSHCGSNQSEKWSYLVIYDMEGRIIANFKLEEFENNSIPLEEGLKGNYLFKFINGEKNLIKRILIEQNLL